MAAPSRDPPTARPSKIPNGYETEEGLQLARAGDDASVLQLFCALDFVAALLQAKGLTYAVLGGFAFTLRGSRRETHDVDIAVACDMRTLREALEGEQRIRMPIGPPSGVMRTFVKVGPSYGDDVNEKSVQVDLFLTGGSFGIPTDLARNSDIVSVPTPADPKKSKEFNILRSE